MPPAGEKRTLDWFGGEEATKSAVGIKTGVDFFIVNGLG